MKKNNIALRIARSCRPIWGWLAFGAFLNILAVGCSMAAPQILGDLVQKLYDFWAGGAEGSITGELMTGLVVLAGLYFAYSAISYGTMQMCNRVVSRYFTCNLRIQISDKIQRLPVRYVDQTPVGDILSRMTGDVSTLGGYLHDVVNILTLGFFQIAAISVVLFLEDWRLALIVVVLAPLSMALSSKIAAKGEENFHKMFEISGDLTAITEEAFSNYPTTKAYNLEEYTAEKHAAVNEKLRAASAKANFQMSTVQPIIAFTNALSYIVLNLFGGWLLVNKLADVGTIAAVVLYAKQFSSPLEQIAQGFSGMNQVKAAGRRIFDILDMEEEPVATGKPDAQVQGRVEFRGLDFSYDPAQPLIRDLNVTVEPGQSVAIVGPTGAGKTTIVNLLMRFYDPVSGRILVDGRDTRQMDRDEVRGLFAMVLQDTWLFRGTIRENVAYGKPDATDEEIIAACKESYCHHFIQTLPQGYDTVIGEDTTNLSGGQKQLLTIARAMLAKRPLLILDEATSNVDTRTEVLIQKAMDRLMEGRTSFVIAHRLSTIVDSDLILVLNEGRIVEQGSHGQLMAKKGFYYQLHQSQYAV